MKSSRNGNAGVDLISDNQSGRENTVVNIGLSSVASRIDALGESINYYAEFGYLANQVIVLINKELAPLLLP
jgi:hypothetical protein